MPNNSQIKSDIILVAKIKFHISWVTFDLNWELTDENKQQTDV